MKRIRTQQGTIEVHDEWQDPIQLYVTDREFVRIKDVGLDVFNIETGKLETKIQARIKAVLRKLKFQNKRVYVDGIQQRVWVREAETGKAFKTPLFVEKLFAAQQKFQN